MGLFKKKMQDPVKGSAKVVEVEGGFSAAGSSVWAPGTMKLMVTADGVPRTSVEWRGQIRCKYCPSIDQTIPLTVDRANPQNVSIEWKELPPLEQVQRDDVEQLDAEAVETWEDAVQDLVEARQMWRENLERGDVTRGQFDAEMRDLEPDLEQARQMWQGFVDRGDVTQEQFEEQMRHLNEA